LLETRAVCFGAERRRHRYVQRPLARQIGQESQTRRSIEWCWTVELFISGHEPEELKDVLNCEIEGTSDTGTEHHY
jgi:flagellar motor component MotA